MALSPYQLAELAPYIAELDREARELRDARQLLQNLTRSAELVDQLRAAPALLAQLEQRHHAEWDAAHGRALDELQQTQAKFHRTADALVDRLASAMPMVDRIQRLVTLLDQARVIQWPARS